MAAVTCSRNLDTKAPDCGDMLAARLDGIWLGAGIRVCWLPMLTGLVFYLLAKGRLYMLGWVLAYLLGG